MPNGESGYTDSGTVGRVITTSSNASSLSLDRPSIHHLHLFFVQLFDRGKSKGQKSMENDRILLNVINAH